MLLGPNGAGKTTLIAMITGQFKPTSGTIVFDGQDITGESPDRIFARRHRPQVPGTEHVRNAAGLRQHHDLAQGRPEGVQIHVQAVTPAENDRIWEILDFIELGGKANDPADTLSHGERQWLELGMLVAADPKLMLLDEPTTGMTDEGKRRTADLIQRIAKNHTVLLVEHDMDVVRQIANIVTVMHQGQVLAEGPLARGRSERDGEGGLSRQGRKTLMLQAHGHQHLLRHQPHPASGVTRWWATANSSPCSAATARARRRFCARITGVNPPKSGMIELNGADITREKSHKRTHLGISYVPQGRQIIPDLTVAENIGVALLGKGVSDIRVPGFVYD